MKVTFYILKNKSGSPGIYLYDKDYFTIYPDEEITLKHKPTNITENIIISDYRREVSEPASKKRLQDDKQE